VIVESPGTVRRLKRTNSTTFLSVKRVCRQKRRVPSNSAEVKELLDFLIAHY
jgi:hypothetical protein